MCAVPLGSVPVRMRSWMNVVVVEMADLMVARVGLGLCVPMPRGAMPVEVRSWRVGGRGERMTECRGGDELSGADECGGAVGAKQEVQGPADGPKVAGGLGTVGELRSFSSVLVINTCGPNAWKWPSSGPLGKHCWFGGRKVPMRRVGVNLA